MHRHRGLQRHRNGLTLNTRMNAEVSVKFPRAIAVIALEENSARVPTIAAKVPAAV